MSKGNLKKIENNRIMEQVRYKHIYCNNFFKFNHSIMIVIESKTGAIMDANEAACSFYQYNYEEIMKLKISDINALPIEETVNEMKLASRKEKKCFYFKHKLANGEIRDVEVHSSPITQNSKQLLYSIVIDITDSKKKKK